MYYRDDSSKDKGTSAISTVLTGAIAEAAIPPPAKADGPLAGFSWVDLSSLDEATAARVADAVRARLDPGLDLYLRYGDRIETP